MKPEKLQNAILDFFKANPNKSFSTRQIAAALELGGASSKLLPSQLRRLLASGDLEPDGPRFRHTPPPAPVEGRISMARSGAGFVRDPESGTDLQILPRDLNGALPGDTVRVVPLPPRAGQQRPMGRVVAVLGRSQRDIVGTLRASAGGHSLYVVPLSPTYRNSFHIEDAHGARPGDRVVLRFSDWENLTLNPVGEIVDVIGPADKPSLDTEAIVRQFGLPREFPSDALSEAETVAARLSRPGRREDLRDLFIFTIDPATARDYDDAISLGVDDSGNRVLGVHIADVSHFVRAGSALDREARKRGNSVYLVDKVIPMLPEQLSNGVCSLRPDEDRLTVSAFLTFDARGRVVGRRFCRSRIRSKLRLTYEEAMAIIAGNPLPTGRDIPGEARRLVLDVHRLAQQMRALRFQKSALDLAVPETQIVLDAEGRMTGVKAAESDVSHELIEECMVAANEAVATELANQGIPSIARHHAAPDPEKLEELAANLVGLGIMPGDLQNPKILAGVVRSLADSPLRYYADMLVLRSMKRAEYSADESGHFGLGKRFYSHFTSPIRRYPDLVLHRQLVSLVLGEKDAQPSLPYLRDVAASCTETEFQAEQAERELVEIKKFRFLQEQIEAHRPLEYDAVVVKVAEFGVFVEVVDLQVSGMVHVSLMSQHFMRYDPGRQTLSSADGSYGVGQRVRVFVAAVNFDERKLDFGLVRDARAQPTPAPRGFGTQRKGRQRS